MSAILAALLATATAALGPAGPEAAGRAKATRAPAAKATRWHSHRSDTRLRPGMVLRGYQGQAHLRVDLGPLRGGGPSRLDAALGRVRQLASEKRPTEETFRRLVGITNEVFPLGTPEGANAYLARTLKVGKHGRSVSLERLAEEGLAACRERAVTLKLFLQEAGFPRARLRAGSYYRQSSAGPAFVEEHAWVEVPVEGGEVMVLDPSVPPGEQVARVRPTRGWITSAGERRLRPYVAVADHYLMRDETWERDER